MSYMLVDVANILSDTKHLKHPKSKNVKTGRMLEASTIQFTDGRVRTRVRKGLVHATILVLGKPRPKAWYTMVKTMRHRVRRSRLMFQLSHLFHPT